MPANAAIYVADPSLLGNRLFDRIQAVESYEGLNQGDLATGVRLKTAWGEVTMNFLPPAELAKHLSGFSGYAGHVIKDRDDLVYALSRIQHVRLCIGCVISHAEEDADAVHNFLFEFNGMVSGLLFTYDTIFDWTGEALGGPLAEENQQDDNG